MQVILGQSLLLPPHPILPFSGATTAEKLRGPTVRVPTPGRVRVREYDPRKIFENSDAKSCILVTILAVKFLAFLKLRPKSWGTNTLLVPQPKSWGSISPGPWLLRLCSPFPLPHKAASLHKSRSHTECHKPSSEAPVGLHLNAMQKLRF